MSSCEKVIVKPLFQPVRSTGFVKKGPAPEPTMLAAEEIAGRWNGRDSGIDQQFFGSEVMAPEFPQFDLSQVSMRRLLVQDIYPFTQCD